MLIAAKIGTEVAIVPRILEIHDGTELAYCNAPTLVRVGFGVLGRKVFLMDEAAAVPCVRNALLNHAAEHSRALDAEIEAFIQRWQQALDAWLRELTQTPAPDRAPALKAFQSGLAAFLFNMVTQFKAEVEHVRKGVDTPSRLEKLRNSCGGLVRQIEQELLSRRSANRPAITTAEYWSVEAALKARRERHEFEPHFYALLVVSDLDQRQCSSQSSAKG